MTPQQPNTSPSQREELFSIMCGVVAEHSQPKVDYKAGKLTVYELGPAEQKILMKYADKAEQLIFQTQKDTITRVLAKIDKNLQYLDEQLENDLLKHSIRNELEEARYWIQQTKEDITELENL